MAQIFSADAQMQVTDVPITLNQETAGVTTNAVHVPFINGKVVVDGRLVMQTGATTTGVQIRVRRNPAAENVVLGFAPDTFIVGAPNIISLPFMFTDSLPDGRDAVYQLSVQQVGATGSGLLGKNSCIRATVMSG
jgi:hypothetical protein